MELSPSLVIPALVVTREEELAVSRLNDHLEGRLPTSEGWVFRLPSAG